MTSCQKKKSNDASFLEDVRDHIDEFIHASMDEHKTCFKKTMQKIFDMTKGVRNKTTEAEEKGVRNKTTEAEEVERSLPLQTTVAQ
ncbi:hypothetical protein Cni_G00962 [Canna indica]|uniref:Uncharacterized protein n=1 Tax=Canna indica TaxID=4628 RepID=A0AAQ3JLP0_9LILI|nr:hypothetical protein Cni_G00962 [Canna indica]